MADSRLRKLERQADPASAAAATDASDDPGDEREWQRLHLAEYILEIKRLF